MRPEGNAELVVASSGSTVPARLTDAERALLHAREAEVDLFLRQRAVAWDALWEIQTKRLYRETHSTFAAYLKDRFDITPSYASRLRKAGAVVEEARRLSPDVAHGQPPAERAIREVNDLPVEEAAKVLVVATESARDEGREVATVADIRKARGGKLEKNRGFRKLPRRPLADRAEAALSAIENDVEYLISEVGLDRLETKQAARLRAAVESLSDLPVEVKSTRGRKTDPRDPRLDDLDKLLRSLAVIPRGKGGRGQGDKAKAVLVLLGDAVIRLVRTMGAVARKSEIELGRHLAMLDGIVEAVEELTWREASTEVESQVVLHVAEVWNATPEEVVENGKLAAAIDKLKVIDPEIETKFLSGTGPSREEILEKARELEEKVEDPPAALVLTCPKCNGPAGPLGGRPGHRPDCPDAPKTKLVVEAGQVWKTQHGKFFLVERVVDDKAVVNLGDGQASGWTEIARVLGEATLVPTPSKAVLATFERPNMEFSIGSKRRRK